MKIDLSKHHPAEYRIYEINNCFDHKCPFCGKGFIIFDDIYSFYCELPCGFSIFIKYNTVEFIYKLQEGDFKNIMWVSMVGSERGLVIEEWNSIMTGHKDIIINPSPIIDFDIFK